MRWARWTGEKPAGDDSFAPGRLTSLAPDATDPTDRDVAEANYALMDTG